MCTPISSCSIGAHTMEVNLTDEGCGLCKFVNSHDLSIRLFHDDYCIVENPVKCLREPWGLIKYERQFSLVVVRHMAEVPWAMEERLYYALDKFMRRYFAFRPSQYFIRKTMNTYPDHWHIHAFLLPGEKLGS